MTRPLRALALLFGIGSLLLTSGCSGPELPVLGEVPEFQLVERADVPMNRGDFDGHVWIASFIFTSCPDVCPALTTQMAQLQKELVHGADPVRLVSISVDPDHDTPAVLKTYAERAGARSNWFFLTGDRPTVAQLLREGFHVAFADDGPIGAPITHSDRFVLIDRAHRIRGYYHGLDQDDVRRLIADAKRL